MDQYTKFENYIKDMDYIRTPYETIYDFFPDANSYDLVEGLRIILVHNHRITLSLDDQNTTLQNKITSAVKVVPETETLDERVDNKPVNNQHTYPQREQVLQIISSLKYYKTTEEFTNNTKNLSQEDIVLIKLYLLKEINTLKRKIRTKVNIDPLADTDIERLQLLTYKSFLDELIIEQEILIEEEQKQEENKEQRIIFVPNGKSNTFFFEDIQNYQDSYDEIYSVFENLISKKFLGSKSISSIKDMGEKLYEYKRTNGIRVIFVKRGNEIYICSLFYKDKQRSTKITSYYEEAIRRFNSFINTQDITFPDFDIEQKELIGLIYGEIEPSTSLTKKKDGE